MYSVVLGSPSDHISRQELHSSLSITENIAQFPGFKHFVYGRNNRSMRIHSGDHQPIPTEVYPGPPTLCMNTYPSFDPSPSNPKNDMIGNGTQILSCILYYLSVHDWESRPPPKRCKQKRHFVARHAHYDLNREVLDKCHDIKLSRVGKSVRQINSNLSTKLIPVHNMAS